MPGCPHPSVRADAGLRSDEVMSSVKLIDEGAPATAPLSPQRTVKTWQTSTSDHTDSGGFCSCCGTVFPCRGALSASR